MAVTNEPVQITCLDKPRSFLLDMGAAIRIEEALKINVLLDIVAFAAALAVPSTVVRITRELLLHEDRRLTPEAVAGMISSAEQVTDLMKSAMRAWFHFQGKSDADYDEFLTKLNGDAQQTESTDPLATAA